MKALVRGAGGFIGHHLVRRLKADRYWVRGVDLKRPGFSETAADEFATGDLPDAQFVRALFDPRFDEVYQLAADMGGAGYIFTGAHDAELMHNSATINLNVPRRLPKSARGARLLLLVGMHVSGVQPARSGRSHMQRRQRVSRRLESEYGWEKLVLPQHLWSRRVMERRQGKSARSAVPQGGPAKDGDEIEIWGDGKQTRSFLYIDECVERTLRLMRSQCTGQVNIGSEEMVSIDTLVDMISAVAGRTVHKRHIAGPTGVRGRNSDNRLIFEKLGWRPSMSLAKGLEPTYWWIHARAHAKQPAARRLEQAAA
jgi:GDP-D-mannose 3', 5'-epimerase